MNNYEVIDDTSLIQAFQNKMFALLIWKKTKRISSKLALGKATLGLIYLHYLQATDIIYISLLFVPQTSNL